MPDGDLRQLASVEEISIGFTRPDRSTGSTPVWVVQAGDAVFVRPIRGRRGGWCRRRANPDGEVGDGAHTHPVRARPVQDAGTVEAVTGADAAKYGNSPYVGQNQDEQAQADPSEAPGFGDRISRRRQGAELGHQLSRAPCR